MKKISNNGLDGARLSKMVGAAAVAVAGFYFYLVSIHGVGRSGAGGFDTSFLYAAGAAWLHDLNAYDPVARLAATPDLSTQVYAFAYPPSAYPLCALLGSLPARLIWHAMIALDLVGIGVVLWLSGKAFANPAKLWMPLLAVVVLTFPFLAHTVFLGQTSVIVVAALMLGWHFRQSRPWLSGLMLAIASMKPQLSLFMLLWLLLDRQWKVLLWFSLFCLLFLLKPLLIAGPTQLVVSWLHEVQAYRASHLNAWGFRHMFGVPNILAKLELPTDFGLPVGVVATVMTWRLRACFQPFEIVALLLTYSLLFFGAHDYDLVGLLPLVVIVYDRFRTSINPTTIFAAITVATLYVPQRWLRLLESPMLLEYRVIAVLVLTFLVLR